MIHQQRTTRPGLVRRASLVAVALTTLGACEAERHLVGEWDAGPTSTTPGDNLTTSPDAAATPPGPASVDMAPAASIDTSGPAIMTAPPPMPAPTPTLDAGPILQPVPTGNPLLIPSDEALRRLTILLWGAPPSPADPVLARAPRTYQEVAALAPALLADPRAERGVGNFYRWWLGLDRLATLRKNPAAYPSWAPALATALASETERFAVHVTLREDRFAPLLTADYSFIDAQIAAVYGLPAPSSPGLVQTRLPPSRSGLLTQPSVLALPGHEVHPSATWRGRYIRENLLCQAIPAPPPNVNRIEMPTRTANMQHLTNPACSACHVLMDDLGYAFTNFDAIGVERRFDGDGTTPVDTSGQLAGIGGTPTFMFANAVELSRHLALEKTVHACFARRWLEYAVGRSVDEQAPADSAALARVVQAFASGGLRLSALITAVATSEAFLSPR